MTDPQLDRVGTNLGRYQIESVLGRGGMSVVYLAADLRLKRRVALKGRMEQVKDIPVRPDSVSLTVAGGSLWVVSRGEGSVWRIDTVTEKRVRIGIGPGPGDIAVDDQSAWVVR